MADGLVGDSIEPNLILYFPVVATNATAGRSSEYWTMIASPVPDMQGSREQSVWFRFQRLRCVGTDRMRGDCALVGRPQYWDTFWWSRHPDGNTGATGPSQAASPSGFYNNLLAVRRYWQKELKAEGIIRRDIFR